MIAEKDPILQQASNDLYTINADEILRQQAQARADAEFWERHTKAKIQKLQEDVTRRDNIIAQKDNDLVQKNNVIAQINNTLAQKDVNFQKFYN